MIARRAFGALGSALGLAGCGLIVGEPQGRLPDPIVVDDAAGDAGPEASCGASCTAVETFACSKGACNAAGGACTSAGQRCACDDDRQCPTGKCIPTAGLNDKSCGPGCTGTGAADGFGCAPMPCGVTGFAFAPSNFDPTAYTPPSGATTDCNGTYSSTTHTFTLGSCGGQAPVVHGGVTQLHGGPTVDVLVFRSLTISGALTLVGANPVILAVYGDARISGTIDASANGATPGPGGNACAAADNGAPTSGGQWEPGAGGGGMSAAGGGGGASNTNPGGAGGAAHGAATSPLAGGCAGGLPGTVNLGYAPAIGAGGGGLQISAAGALDLTGGTVKANGSGGGPGEAGKCQNLYPAQNGTGGAGGGSGGVVLLEGTTVTGGTLSASGGTGGAGGTAAAPNGQAGGAGGAAGKAGKPGVQMGSTPSGCSWGGIWSGGGGGGGADGTVKTNAAGAGCACTSDSACASGACANVSSACTGTCTASTAPGTYDSDNCQIVTSAGADASP